MQQGMIPNRFDDYAQAAHYNSIDASLWFVLAADRYVQASGDEAAWARELAGPVERIVQSYHDGTMFDIRADADGLITGGSDQTQLTWMDVKLAGIPVTPRHGKCVEVNALWHTALRIAERRCADGPRARMFGDWAKQVANAFGPTFWNEQMGYLYDCVMGQWKDGTLRPNQVIAVALPDCPLPIDQQRAVVKAVQDALLTPVGLRSLSPYDSRYRGRFGISLESRDKAYHQGMVWGWLIGPFIEAHLRVNYFSDTAKVQARQWLGGFEAHLQEAGLGNISEVFDGDNPHAPGGCIAQAWSVAEVLRAKRLIETGGQKSAPAGTSKAPGRT
jgi:predicted glycogen debranching enzyme